MNTSEKLMRMDAMGERVELVTDPDGWLCRWTVGGVAYTGHSTLPSEAVDNCIAKSHRGASFVKEEPKKK